MSEFTIAQQRKVVTEIPGPKSQALQAQRLKAVGAGVGTALGIFVEKANGAIIIDADGNHIIDLGSGIGVTTIGHLTPVSSTRFASRLVNSPTHFSL